MNFNFFESSKHRKILELPHSKTKLANFHTKKLLFPNPAIKQRSKGNNMVSGHASKSVGRFQKSQLLNFSPENNKRQTAELQTNVTQKSDSKQSPQIVGRVAGRINQSKLVSKSHIDFSKLQEQLQNIPSIDNSHLSRFVAKHQYFSQEQDSSRGPARICPQSPPRQNLAKVIEVQKMSIGHQKLVQPVNFDKKKSRMQYKYMIEDFCKIQQQSHLGKRSINETSALGNEFLDTGINQEMKPIGQGSVMNNCQSDKDSSRELQQKRKANLSKQDGTFQEGKQESRANSGSLLSSDQIQIEKYGSAVTGGGETTKTRHRIKAQVFSVSPTFQNDKKVIKFNKDGGRPTEREGGDPYNHTTSDGIDIFDSNRSQPHKKENELKPNKKGNLSFQESSKDGDLAQTQQLSQKEAEGIFTHHATQNQHSNNEETINVDPAQTDKLISVSQSNPTSKDKTFSRPRPSHSREMPKQKKPRVPPSADPLPMATRDLCLEDKIMSQEVLNKIKELENIVSLASKNNESTRDVVFWAKMIEKNLGKKLYLLYKNITKDVFLSIMKGFLINIHSERIKSPEAFGKTSVDLIRKLFKELEMQHNYKINISNLDRQEPLGPESVTMTPDHVSAFKSPQNPKSNQSHRHGQNILAEMRQNEDLLDPFRGRSPSFPNPLMSQTTPIKEDKGQEVQSLGLLESIEYPQPPITHLQSKKPIQYVMSETEINQEESAGIDQSNLIIKKKGGKRPISDLNLDLVNNMNFLQIFDDPVNPALSSYAEKSTKGGPALQWLIRSQNNPLKESYEAKKGGAILRKDSTGSNKSPKKVDDEKESINEIIVKIEMKKFQNLINKRMKRQNNLVNADIKRIFPLNKFSDNLHKKADDHISFKDGIGKFNPKLSSHYISKHRHAESSGNVKTQNQTVTSQMFSHAASKSQSPDHQGEQATVSEGEIDQIASGRTSQNIQATTTAGFSNEFVKKRQTPQFPAIQTTQEDVINPKDMLMITRSQMGAHTGHAATGVHFFQKKLEAKNLRNMRKSVALGGQQKDDSFERTDPEFHNTHNDFRSKFNSNYEGRYDCRNDSRLSRFGGMRLSANLLPNFFGKPSRGSYDAKQHGLGTRLARQRNTYQQYDGMASSDFENPLTLMDSKDKLQSTMEEGHTTTGRLHENEQSLLSTYVVSANGEVGVYQIEKNQIKQNQRQDKRHPNIFLKENSAILSRRIHSDRSDGRASPYSPDQMSNQEETGQIQVDRRVDDSILSKQKAAGLQKPTLQEKYMISGDQLMKTNTSQVKPYGWKIGLYQHMGDVDQDYNKKVAQFRAVHKKRQQREHAKLLKDGIDKMVNDKFYREMYTKYKESQGQYESAQTFNAKLLMHMENLMGSDHGPGMDSAERRAIHQPKRAYKNELSKILNEYCDKPPKKMANV